MMNKKSYSTVPKRFIWAVDVLGVKPSDHVLEIGCGVGLMAEIIGSKLVDGKLVAIDKSSFMIDKAKRRKPGGKLFIFYQDPYEITIQAAELITEKLTAHGFSVIDTILKELSPTSAICVVAVPNQ